jgi:hypothetical protein
MLVRPRNRICPSDMRSARTNTLRQLCGLKKGSKPSITNIKANALIQRSPMMDAAAEGQRDAPSPAFDELERDDDAAPRIARKKSLDGSSTSTSDLLWKLARYASKLR